LFFSLRRRPPGRGTSGPPYLLILDFQLPHERPPRESSCTFRFFPRGFSFVAFKGMIVFPLLVLSFSPFLSRPLLSSAAPRIKEPLCPLGEGPHLPRSGSCFSLHQVRFSQAIPFTIRRRRVNAVHGILTPYAGTLILPTRISSTVFFVDLPPFITIFTNAFFLSRNSDSSARGVFRS